MSQKPIVFSLSSPELTFAMAGGKGINLTRLTLAGLSVPAGFAITTDAYQIFIKFHRLDEEISQLINGIDFSSPELLEEFSASIRKRFQQVPIPNNFRDPILKAYRQLGSSPVAVRSSATAEDLPDLSFAGQQDTFLNVIGEENLLNAVRSCWSSLWTARAISYRHHNHISQNNLSLAVIVQKMVQSEVSGVAFTANPLNGIRSQIVINATPGLGEALVSGKVDADQYIVERENNLIISKRLGKKAISIRSAVDGGTYLKNESDDESQALSDSEIIDLSKLCAKVESLYIEPQDIEWAKFNGDFHLLQSRPITSLFPIPPGVTSSPLKVFASFGAIQGVVNPLTPLGQQMLLLAFAGGARIFGYHHTIDNQRTFLLAGERFWTDITPVVKNTVGKRLAPMILGIVEPTMRQAILTLINDPRLQPERTGIRPRTTFHLLRFMLPVLGNVFLNLLSPEQRQKSCNMWIGTLLSQANQENLQISGSRDQKLVLRIANLEKIFWLIQKIFPRLVSLVATGMATLNFTSRLIDKIPASSPDEKAENNRLYLELTRGLPNNVTTEMDLALWECAKTIQSDPESMAKFSQVASEDLVRAYSDHILPEIAQAAVTKFMTKYGLRGVGEIDMGRERWKDNPLQVFQTLQSYIKITNPDKAPDVVFKRGEQSSLKAQSTILEKLRHQKHGWQKTRQAKFLMHRYRAFGGFRETPKFTLIRLTGAIRMGLLESGEEFVQDGILNHPTDLFFLYVKELKELASGVNKDWKSIVMQRRATDDREKARRQIPRIFLSTGQAFYEGIINDKTDDETSLIGAPVSPGVAEGIAKIVLDPRLTTLDPGEVLVCPGTDPAWTPLFLSACALVMEVGGLMTHGAVVAREYGIPAVVGVDQATIRIKTGQKIRVNGTTGQITILSLDS